MERDRSFDVIVAGAGPGGSTTAALAARAGLKVLLVDRARFPRDKICGDAISGKSVDVLRRLGLLDRLQAREQIGTWGITFGGPGGAEAAIPFSRTLDRAHPLGFVCAREVFDALLFDHALESGAEVWQETVVESLSRDGAGRVTGLVVKRQDAAPETVWAPLVVGADGAYSAVARALGMKQLDEAHYCGGLRAYYEGVVGFHEMNHLEVHFLPEVIPGYFWIFPMAGGRANVGIGMLSKAMKARDVRLKELLDFCVSHPRFRHRFAGARRLGPVKGWGLPLGSRPRTMAGDGWLLVGDAASLIDPFSGEGIGNAMVSGEKAAAWAVRAHHQADFSVAFLAGYEREVLGYLRSELRVSHAMQRLIHWKGLLDIVIRKASRSRAVADALSCMFDDESQRRRLLSPAFYLRLLFA